VGSWDKLQRWVIPRVTGPLLALSGQTSIAVAYNAILDAYQGMDLEAVVLLHDDLEITDPGAEEVFLTTLADDSVGLVGVAGGADYQGLAWWNMAPVGHQQTDAMNIDFGPRSGDVAILEGSILVFSPYAAKTFRFDTSLGGFHGYDEISKQVTNAGLRAVVVDVDTYHHNSMGFKSEDSHQEWLRGDRFYREKWYSSDAS
jgi:hypothetical protein